MAKFDLNTFEKRVSLLQLKKQRHGQALFNALAQMNSDWAKEIISTENDPFYKDKNINNFYTFLYSKIAGGD